MGHVQVGTKWSFAGIFGKKKASKNHDPFSEKNTSWNSSKLWVWSAPANLWGEEAANNKGKVMSLSNGSW
jgi:hypothetical protein